MLESRRLSVGFVALGVGLAVNSLLGPFVLDVVEYPLSETLLNQTIGLDAFSLIVVAPLCLVIALLSLQGSVLGALLGVGVAAYAVYMLIQYIVGPAYLEYPRILALQLPLLVAAGRSGWRCGAASMRPCCTRCREGRHDAGRTSCWGSPRS